MTKDPASQLTDPQRRMVDLLATVHPGTWIDVKTAAALSGVNEDAAASILEVLAGTGVLRHSYALPDPGWRPTCTSITPQQQGEAFGRLVEELLRMGAAAQLAIIPGRPYLGRYLQERPVVAFTEPDALAWMETALPTLVALQRRAHELGMYQEVWELAECCWGLFNRRKRLPSWDVMYRRGLDAAIATGDPAAQARMRIGLAQLHMECGEPGHAAEEARTAREIERQLGSRLGEAIALESLGVAALALGRPEEAREHFTEARHTHQDLGRSRGAALAARHEGEAALAAGFTARARKLVSEAVHYFAVVAPERYQEGRALLTLAHVRIGEGNVVGAKLAAESALEISCELGTPREQSRAYGVLAEAADLQGNAAVADRYRQYAGDIEELLREERRAVIAPATQ